MALVNEVLVILLAWCFYTSGAQSLLMKQNVRKNFGDHRLISLSQSDVTDVVHEILHRHHFDDVGHADGNLHFKLSKEAVEALEYEGVSIEDNTEEFLSEMERNLNSDQFICEEDTAYCATQPPSIYYNSYQKLETIYERFRRFSVAYPHMTKYESLGTTYEGREQKVLWIGDQSKPLVYYFCAIHAREWITPMFCTYMAETLLDTSNEVSKSLLKTFSFAITPVGNPDGYAYTHSTDNAWRKTRKPNNGTSCIGTDPNRNYATGWGGSGASDDPCSNIYHGLEPFDQDCTSNIRSFTDAHEERLIHVNDVHAKGEYWMSPFAWSTDLPPVEDWERMDQCNHAVYEAIKATSGLEFKIGPVSTTIYEASGGAVDYFYEENGVVHSYTYEARGAGLQGVAGWQPPTENIMLSNIELFAGMAGALECIKELELPGDNVPEENNAGAEDVVPKSYQDIGVGLFAGLGFLTGLLIVLSVAVTKSSQSPISRNPQDNRRISL